jgi:hypothetical protein
MKFLGARRFCFFSLSVTLSITIPHAKATTNACCGIFISIVANFTGSFSFNYAQFGNFYARFARARIFFCVVPTELIKNNLHFPTNL